MRNIGQDCLTPNLIEVCVTSTQLTCMQTNKEGQKHGLLGGDAGFIFAHGCR